MQGDDLDLSDFPLARKSLDDFGFRRLLAAPGPVGNTFSFLFGAVLPPPLHPLALIPVYYRPSKRGQQGREPRTDRGSPARLETTNPP